MDLPSPLPPKTLTPISPGWPPAPLLLPYRPTIPQGIALLCGATIPYPGHVAKLQRQSLLLLVGQGTMAKKLLNIIKLPFARLSTFTARHTLVCKPANLVMLPPLAIPLVAGAKLLVTVQDDSATVIECYLLRDPILPTPMSHPPNGVLNRKAQLLPMVVMWQSRILSFLKSILLPVQITPKDVDPLPLTSLVPVATLNTLK